MGTVLEIKENEKGLKWSGKSQRIREKKRGESGKVREFDRLSEGTPPVQLDDLGFCQSALPSLGKFFEIRQKSGKTRIKRDTPLNFMTFYTTV